MRHYTQWELTLWRWGGEGVEVLAVEILGEDISKRGMTRQPRMLFSYQHLISSQ